MARLAQSVEHATLNHRLVGSRSTLAIVLSTESHYKEKLCGADKTSIYKQVHWITSIIRSVIYKKVH